MPHLEHEFCLYEALEITKDATQQDVVTSYRRLARIHHPDKNPDDPEATGKFQKVRVFILVLRKLFFAINFCIPRCNSGVGVCFTLELYCRELTR